MIAILIIWLYLIGAFFCLAMIMGPTGKVPSDRKMAFWVVVLWPLSGVLILVISTRDVLRERTRR